MGMANWNSGPINGERLRLMRYLIGWTLHQIGQKAKLSDLSIWSWESGQRTVASARSVQLLATALNIAPAFLQGADIIPAQVQAQLDSMPTEVLLAEVTRRFPQMGDRTTQMKMRFRQAKGE